MTGEPEETALYHVFGEADLLLYIGISKDFGRRWKEHAKKQPWWDEKRRLTVDGWYDFRPEAEAAEETAIKAERPKYNKRHAVRTPAEVSGAACRSTARQKRAIRDVPPSLSAEELQDDPGLLWLRARFGTPATGTLLMHDAEEAASLIGCTPNWLMTKARTGQVVHTLLGRKVLWTPNQVTEILRAGEQKPRLALVARPPARRRAAAGGGTALQARPQRRKQGAA